MSATGKSTLIGELAARGYNAFDADENGLSELRSVPVARGAPDSTPAQDWVWREDRIQDLLSNEDAEVMFLSGCATNQVKFYSQFDHIILLSAPASTIVQRLATRTTNSYGKHPDELARILFDQQTVEPLLRRVAGLEVDTTAPLAEVVASVLQFVLESNE
jgi:dephospho-CoA kinase